MVPSSLQSKASCLSRHLKVKVQTNVLQFVLTEYTVAYVWVSSRAQLKQCMPVIDLQFLVKMSSAITPLYMFVVLSLFVSWSLYACIYAFIYSHWLVNQIAS